MPKVSRVHMTSGDRPKPAKVEKVSWSELTSAERRSAIAKRAIAAILLAGAVIASLPDGPVDFWGDAKARIPLADQKADLARQAIELNGTATLAKRYEQTYISPVAFKTREREGGKGILGKLDVGYGAVHGKLGQQCLAGTAYDSLASETRSGILGRANGELSAVAALAVDGTGNEVTIHPAGSDAPSLNFSLSPAGELVADAPTAQTLRGYGCDPGLHAYIQEDSYLDIWAELPLAGIGMEMSN